MIRSPRYTFPMLAQWVRDALAHAKMTQVDLAERLTKKLGQSFDKAAINKMAMVKQTAKTKARGISAAEMMAIAEITGYPPPMADELTRAPLGEEFQPDPDFDADVYEGASSAEPYKSRLPGARPEIDVKAGAGLGSFGPTVGIDSKGIVTGHRVVAEWVFPDPFLRHEMGASPGSVVVMAVTGDSMRPTLDPEDRILVDTGQNTHTSDTVYVIDDGDGEPRVKRLLKVLFSKPPQVLITSDNPVAKDSERSVNLAEVRIVGRVVGRLTRM